MSWRPYAYYKSLYNKRKGGGAPEEKNTPVLLNSLHETEILNYISTLSTLRANTLWKREKDFECYELLMNIARHSKSVKDMPEHPPTYHRIWASDFALTEKDMEPLQSVLSPVKGKMIHLYSGMEETPPSLLQPGGVFTLEKFLNTSMSAIVSSVYGPTILCIEAPIEHPNLFINFNLTRLLSQKEFGVENSFYNEREVLIKEGAQLQTQKIMDVSKFAVEAPTKELMRHSAQDNELIKKMQEDLDSGNVSFTKQYGYFDEDFASWIRPFLEANPSPYIEWRDVFWQDANTDRSWNFDNIHILANAYIDNNTPLPEAMVDLWIKLYDQGGKIKREFPKKCRLIYVTLR